MPDVFVSHPPKENPIEKSPSLKTVEVSKKENHIHTLASFCEYPPNTHFQTQDSDESILLFLRMHITTNIPWIIITLLLLLFPLFIPFLLSSLALPSDFLTGQIIVITTFFYYSLIFTYAFINFITWYYNIGLVTQKRVIDIDFSHVVYHDVAQTKLNLVEDVNYTQTGFIRSFFNYGDVFIQTAGGKENIEFLAVPTPGKAVKIIADLIGKGAHSG